VCVTDVSDPETKSGIATRSRLLANWRYVLRTSNPPAGRVDAVSRGLVITRASVLPMTITAAAIAGLLAAFHDEHVRWGLFALAAVGLVLAHVANNLMNDLFDLEVGSDTDSYPRALYAPHPVLSGMISRRGLLTSAIVVNAADLAILVVLLVFRGWPMVVFALSGFVLSVAYTAPPLRLKKHGLGEATVLVVWGPLMVGGAYYAATGHFPFAIFVASLPYALLCTAVLMGKHIDKIPWDAPDGTRTLPVLLGEAKARALTQGMMISFYVLVVLLVGTGTLPIAALIVLVALHKLATVWPPFSQPKPAEPPENFPIWPLWFAALAFVHTRRAGGLLVLGLIVGVILGW
jgi:1,4-dihydroxy-2-naphthoate polyprenyltransferase